MEASEQQDFSMLELFKIELETQTAILSNALLTYEREGSSPGTLEVLMRAAHSVKGAARVVRVDQVVQITHLLEDCFIAAQQEKITLTESAIDFILKTVDFLTRLSKASVNTIHAWLIQSEPEVKAIIEGLKSIYGKNSGFFTPAATSIGGLPIAARPQNQLSATGDRVLRVTAHSLNRLMGLAGESMVESRWLHPFSDALMKLKKLEDAVLADFDQLNEATRYLDLPDNILKQLGDIQQKCGDCRKQLADRLAELELFINRHSSLSDRLYREVIDSRMRPFADGVESYPRMVRDLAKQLQKRVKLEIFGKSTSVDRDILDKLEAPLAHLVRNAIDHGIELPEERVAKGKSAEGIVRIEATHRAGMLSIIVSDDGKGIDAEALRKKVVDKGLVKADIAANLSEGELIDFLFLPGFTTAPVVTDLSGRGIGLNIVQNMVHEVGGSIRIQSTKGEGTRFNLQLPLTLSVIRSLAVEIAGEPYAFPLAKIERALHIPLDSLEAIEGRQYFNFEGTNIGLVAAWQILELGEPVVKSPVLPVIVLSDRTNLYGLVVDRFIGEKELVVQEIDPRLGKISDVSAGAFMEDGAPLLILDIEDLVRSIDIVLSGGRLQTLSYVDPAHAEKPKKKILVVDDSVTVREVECRLLRSQGYQVETAVNGMDGWNAVRMGDYDLIVTDIDMPRMNGIELIKAIRADPRLKHLPIMIVSYKEREEDRLAGLEAGANYYLTKSSFHDESLINGIVDLIGG